MVDTRHTWFLGALLLGALAPAQQNPEQPPKVEAPSAQQEYDTLAKAFSAAQREANQQAAKAAAAAKAAGEKPPVSNVAALIGEWLPKFQAGAEKFKGGDGAVPFLIWIGNNSKGPERDAVLATLLTDHIKSPAIGGVIRLITSQLQTGRVVDMTTGKAVGEGPKPEIEARVRTMLAKLIQENPSPDLQAQALLARANLVLQSRGKVEDEARKVAIEDIREGFARAVDKDIKSQCEGILFENDHLASGMTAPEIEGKDLDGVAFKLSDYRGKVVLLDFWGYW